MTGRLEARDRARLGRGGLVPMSSATGLALFDAALAQGRSLVVPAQFALATIRSNSAIDGVPPIFRGLVAAARRTSESAAAAGSPSDLRRRLSVMSAAERERELLGIIRSHAAAVLGHASGDAVGIDRDLIKELGLDSLGAVELWNRLKSATGVKLSTSAVFDHPTAKALAHHLAGAFVTAGGPDTAQREKAMLTTIREEDRPLVGSSADA